MVHYTSTLVAFASLVATALAAPASINTPTALVQCQPYQVTWTAGEGGPYFVTVIPGGQAGAAPLADLGTFPTGTLAYTWNVALPAGTSVTLQIVDSAGQPNYSQQVTIREGSSTTCTAAAAGGAAGASSGASAATSDAASSPATRASRTVAGAASSAASMASSAAGGAVSMASSAAGGAASMASSAGAGASSAAASARPTSGASTLAVGSALGAVGLVAAVML